MPFSVVLYYICALYGSPRMHRRVCAAYCPPSRLSLHGASYDDDPPGGLMFNEPEALLWASECLCVYIHTRPSVYICWGRVGSCPILSGICVYRERILIYLLERARHVGGITVASARLNVSCGRCFLDGGEVESCCCCHCTRKRVRRLFVCIRRRLGKKRSASELFHARYFVHPLCCGSWIKYAAKSDGDICVRSFRRFRVSGRLNFDYLILLPEFIDINACVFW